MQKQYFWQRCCFFLLGIFTMTLGIALSCKADLGSTPISSIPWVMSMFTSFTIGQLTIFMNLILIALQPLMVRSFYWRNLLGQLLTLLIFGYALDLCMFLLDWVHPSMALLQWGACLLSTFILSIGIYLCVRAKIFVASGEGFVLALAFATRLKFSLAKNIFDILLVLIALGISLGEFGGIRGVGFGTMAAAVLTGRFVQLINKNFHALDKYLVPEE